MGSSIHLAKYLHPKRGMVGILSDYERIAADRSGLGGES